MIEGDRSAGATWLVDDRSHRRRVAIASGTSADSAQPLIAPSYYLRRALEPFADVSEWRDSASDPIVSLLAEKPSVLALADMSVAPGPERDAIERFLDDGGVLVRFAGARLAAGDDDLTPTALRRGGRTLGGALSWETPKHIAPFEKGSPFFGLSAPDEVTVTRQVLAEPEEGLAEKTWARLADGTPLVTAARRGKGLIVLFHVTADTTWSNLPLSGLFVDMLRRVVAEAGSPAGATEAQGARGHTATVPPWRTLNGFGALGVPPPQAEPIGEDFSGVGDATHPPGLYGAPDSLSAVNALAAEATLAPADYGPLKVRSGVLEAPPAVDLRAWLLPIALVGLMIDALVSLWIGRAWGLRHRGAVAAIALVAALGALSIPDASRAAEAAISARDMESALSARLAYVTTGDATVDETSRLGLAALTRVLSDRTSADLAEPIAVDPARDELAFYPLIYWPIVARQPQPSPQARARLAAYMKNGGTVLFDTRDALTANPDGPPTPEALWLRALLDGVDVPALEPAPRDHVLTKTFYLLDRIVGRTAIGQTWVEALPSPDPNDRAQRPVRAGDSVSPIIIVVRRSRRRLGDRRRRTAALSARPRRRPAAGACAAQRRQHRDVHAHRELQGGSGSRQGHHRKADAVTSWSIDFAPLVPVWILYALAAAAVVIAIALIWRGTRGAWLRSLAFGLALLGLCDPRLVQENRRPLKDVVAVVVDRSESNAIGGRTGQTDKARDQVEARLKALGDVDLRVVETSREESDTEGTRLFAALRDALADAPPERVGGAIMITDGDVHDIPGAAAALGFDAPLHALITGHAGERQRRIELIEAPRYGIVGKDQVIARASSTARITASRSS